MASVALTFSAGLQVISFWAIRAYFVPAWRLPDLFLAVYPFSCAPSRRLRESLDRYCPVDASRRSRGRLPCLE